MKYAYRTGVLVPMAQKFYKQLILAVAGIFMATFAMTSLMTSAATPNWSANTGSLITFSCAGTNYEHTLLTVNQDDNGNLTGTGRYNTDNSYTWDLTGTISGDILDASIVYTGTQVGSTYDLNGTITADGSIVGTSSNGCESFVMPSGSFSGLVEDSTVIVVSNQNLNGWTSTSTSGGSNSFVADATAPIGTGALNLQTSSDVNSRTRLSTKVDVPLDEVTKLSYMTKQIAAADIINGNATLRISIDTNNDGLEDDQLMYEPYYNGFNGTTMTGWQTWDLTTGKFWSNYGEAYNGFDCQGEAGGYTCNFTLADVLVSESDAEVIGLIVSMGTYNVSQSVNVDRVQLNNTIYDFEYIAPKVLSAKDDCKNGGWEGFVSVNNVQVAFKNQGDCVSYFATKGKNQPAGSTTTNLRSR